MLEPTVETKLQFSKKHQILIYTISGTFKCGSEGNVDGDIIHPEIHNVALYMHKHGYKKILFDLRHLDYRMSDSISAIFTIGTVYKCAYIVGAQCEAGLVSLKKAFYETYNLYISSDYSACARFLIHD